MPSQATTTALPARTTSRDLYLDTCARAEAGVTFMHTPEAAAQWWNWYMTTPSWDAYFLVQSVPDSLADARPGEYPGRRRTTLRASVAASAAETDFPRPWDAGAHIFLSSLCAELTRRGCPDLRGSQYTV